MFGIERGHIKITAGTCTPVICWESRHITPTMHVACLTCIEYTQFLSFAARFQSVTLDHQLCIYMKLSQQSILNISVWISTRYR
jgi:hypothetical protein